jgi:hypothetical protein
MSKTKPLPPPDAEVVAALIRRFQGLTIPKTQRQTTAGDLARHNDTVRAVADAQLDFFDVPAAFPSLLMSGGRESGGGEGME